MSNKFTAGFFLLLFLCLFTANAQQAVLPAGGDASGTGGSVSYSIGQIVYTTVSGSSGKVSQGVQQAYEIFSVGIEDWPGGIVLHVFPNPTSDQLTLEIKGYQNQSLAYRLTDTNGRLLKKEMITADQTRIDMHTWPEAAFFLSVTLDNKQAQTFKIVKK